MDLPIHQQSMTVLMTPDAANFSGNVPLRKQMRREMEQRFAAPRCSLDQFAKVIRKFGL